MTAAQVIGRLRGRGRGGRPSLFVANFLFFYMVVATKEEGCAPLFQQHDLKRDHERFQGRHFKYSPVSKENESKKI